MKGQKLRAKQDERYREVIMIYSFENLNMPLVFCSIEHIHFFIGKFMANELRHGNISEYDFIIESTQFCDAR